MAARTGRPAGRARQVGRVQTAADLRRLVHVGASEVGLIDSALPRTDPDHDRQYRDLLERVTGHRSSTACTWQQLHAVLWELKGMGFVVRPPRRVGRKPPMQPGDLRSKLEALLSDMGEPWGYAEAILRQMRGLPREIACPVSGATALELRALVAACDVERAKRQALADLDAALLRIGRTRADVAAALALRGGWERRRTDLFRAAVWADERDMDAAADA